MSQGLSDLKSVYLIHGSEPLRLEQAVDRLKRRVAEAADIDFNIDTFDGESAKAADVVASCNTLPFLSERRLVVVNHVDKMPKSELDELVDYVNNPSPSTIFVMVAVKIAKNTRLFKAVDKRGGVSEYKAPQKPEYPGEVRRMFAEKGKEAPLRAAELLVNSVGYDLRRLSTEVEKIVAFVGDRKRITAADVSEVVVDTAETSIYEYLDALGNRECERSLTLLGRLFAAGQSEYAIHTMSVRQIRDLIAAQALIERGQGSAAAIARAIGKMEWQAKALPRQARAFSAGELTELLRAAAQTEAQMKTSRDSRLVFELWVMKVCGAGA